MDNYLSDSEVKRAQNDGLSMGYVQKLLDFYMLKHEDILHETYIIFCTKLKYINRVTEQLQMSKQEDLDLFLKLQKSIPEIIETIESLKKKSDGKNYSETGNVRSLSEKMKS